MRWVISIVVLSLCLVAARLLANQGEDAVAISLSRGDATLTIPKSYVVSRRLAGVDDAQGLDSDEGAVVVRIPAQELQAILPNDVPKVRDLVLAVRVLTQVEARQLVQQNNTLAGRIAARADEFGRSLVEYDAGHDWYRLYKIPNVRFMSYVLARDKVVRTSDVIALCSKTDTENEACGLLPFVVREVGVEVTLPADLLIYRGEIVKYISSLIANWKAAERVP